MARKSHRFLRGRRRGPGRLEERVFGEDSNLRGLAEDASARSKQLLEEKGKPALHGAEQLLTAAIARLLALVFALLAVLATVVFLVIALAHLMPLWVAGLCGAAMLAGVGFALAAIARQRTRAVTSRSTGQEARERLRARPSYGPNARPVEP